MSAYHRRLTSDDSAVRSEAARDWSSWEGSTSRLHVDPDYIARFGEDRFAEAFARIEAHYAGHSVKEPGILSALVQATDDLADQFGSPG